MASMFEVQNLNDSSLFDYDGTQYLSMYDQPETKPVFRDTLLDAPPSSEITYTDISGPLYSPKAYPRGDPSISSETDLLSWTRKHPEHWGPNEVLDWLYFLAEDHQVDSTTFRGEAFQKFSGLRLCSMSAEDYIALDPTNGALVHELFDSLLKSAKFYCPIVYPEQMPPTSVDDVFLGNSHSIGMDIKLEDDSFNMLEATNTMLDNNINDLPLFMNGNEARVSVDGIYYDVDFNSKFDWPVDSMDGGYGSAGYDSGNDSPKFTIPRVSSSSDISSTSSEDDMYTRLPMVHRTFSSNSKRKFSSTSTDEGCEVEERKPVNNRGRRQGQASKGNHLWEFIRDLLKNPVTNPSFLKWEDKETGVFRFVQSEAVAHMWGRKKNNPGMTYEKLSRAMRFCKTAGYFEAVPKNGKFPKKLVFKFGTKSHGWQDMDSREH